MADYINQFLDINDGEKARDYLNYLIKDLKLLSLVNPKIKEQKEAKRDKFDV